jgi:short-subunit dehydrogenase
MTHARVVVITGGSAGIGAALGREVTARGGRVMLAARSAAALAEVASSIGSAAATVTADVTRRADVERVRDEALRAFGRIDVWVNNAGRGIVRPVLELSDADFDEMMAVNVKSALYGMQVVVPYFVAQGRGQLMNVSSLLGRVPLASPRSAYSAAKAALHSLTTNLRMDLAATAPGVHVTLVIPGIVTTGFSGRAIGAESATAAPPSGAGVMQPQTAEEVARMMVDVMETPVPELYTNPAAPEIIRRFLQGGL